MQAVLLTLLEQGEVVGGVGVEYQGAGEAGVGEEGCEGLGGGVVGAGCGEGLVVDGKRESVGGCLEDADSDWFLGLLGITGGLDEVELSWLWSVAEANGLKWLDGRREC